MQVIGNTIYKEGATWKAETNINDAKNATAESESNADVVSWWCDRGGVIGGDCCVLGIAFLGGLCNFPANTNLNEMDKFNAGAGAVGLK